MQETWRFGVRAPAGEVTALLTRTTWESHQAACSDATLAEIYRSNQALIDEAVQRRILRGDRSPVQLRASDLALPEPGTGHRERDCA